MTSDDVFDYMLSVRAANEGIDRRRGELLENYWCDRKAVFGCQFIIATHSPFLFSMRRAKIYDLDAEPAAACRWTELPAVRAYYDLFKKHAESFEKTAGASEK